MNLLQKIFGSRQRVEPQNAGFDDTPMGIAFRPVWERKNQPTAGALVYAWETYGLVPFNMSGTGITSTRRINPLMVPMFTQQGAFVTGLPTIAGQIMPQALLNPQNSLPPGQV